MAKTQMMNNLEVVGEMIGSITGIAEQVEKPSYAENLIRRAHNETSTAFDIAAAATASTGKLNHMYEFGTAGITEGQPKHMDPTSQEARLWYHKLAGRGGNLNAIFVFRPALTRNPQPTTKRTGVASKYLRKLSRRKYLFWNKAYVMETGMEVAIKTKEQTHLFVPFNDKPARNPRYADKHHVWWSSDKKGPIKSVPGETVQGNFTTLWVTWWARTGNAMIEKNVRDSVTSDTKRAIEVAVKNANGTRVKPSSLNDLKRASEKAKRSTRKVFEVKRNVRTRK